MSSRTSGTTGREGLQVSTALGIGAVIALIGILGFIFKPVEGQLFGLFGVNTLHNAGTSSLV